MELLPESLIDRIYKYSHEILYSEVLRQLNTYRLNIVCNVPLEFLKYGYYEYKGVRVPCINISDINASAYESLSIINRITIEPLEKKTMKL